MEILRKILKKKGGKIVLVVADGLGGVPHPDFDFKTELEYAKTPNLDKLARESVLGLTIPIDFGITPGSGPAHMSLFGYDPIENDIGRGVLEALGINFALEDDDLAIRGNFCTLDENGLVVDRRAGRIPTEESKKLVEKLQKEIGKIEDVEVILKPGKEHRFVLVLRGEGLGEGVKETDPQKEGSYPIDPEPVDENGVKTSRVLKEFLRRAREILKDEEKANFVLLRGYSKPPRLVPFEEKYGLRPLALAYYPMYKGLTRLLKMETPDGLNNFDELLDYMEEHYSEYDFFYIHYKDTDKAGEDGDFLKKVEKIEYFDSKIPRILKMEPDVLAITGDHSTPSLMASHSFHPNPLLVRSRIAGSDDAREFNERTCKNGYLGIFHAVKLMPLLLAMAERLKKFGA